MDIIDILIARAKSFTGETKTLINRAKKAMSDAETVVDNVSAVEQAALDAQSAAETAAGQAADAAEDFAEMKSDIEGAAAALVDDAIDEKLAHIDLSGSKVHLTDRSTFAAKIQELEIQNDTGTTIHNFKNYTSTGQNEDGSMTQKAITNELSKVVVNNLGAENEGKIVVVGHDGGIESGSVTEAQIQDVINGGSHDDPSGDSRVLGVIIDYENKIVTRCEAATNLTPGQNFDQYTMYGGRKRCNVNSNGQITAWYGDSAYRDDGSNGDVMVYQPKFYYKRTINKTANAVQGKIVRKETLLISASAISGFKLHPRFKDTSGETLEYILMPAYEGCAYDVSNATIMSNNDAGIDFSNDKLMSCAYVKPLTGQNNDLNITAAEALATNKGTGWHITDIGVESINQMLFMVEYASLNAQNAIGAGVSNANGIINTGATAGLGNASGEGNNSAVDGEKAVSYRGFENPWGNTWRFVNGIGIKANSGSRIGVPHITTSLSYDPENLTNYESAGFNSAQKSSWISGMGYENSNYDWVYFPAECNSANSAVPVGDNFWPMTDFTKNSIVGIGGTYAFNLYDGLFYYSCDRAYNYYSSTYNARVMFIPTKNSTYNSNYQAWLTKIGG